MSAHWEARIWTAHPLAPQARLILFAIARAVPDGQAEVLVNRTALARDLEAPGDAVRRALIAGEAAHGKQGGDRHRDVGVVFVRQVVSVNDLRSDGLQE